jgi:hypothetical protein
MLMSVVWGVAPFLILGALFWFFFIRQIKIAGKGALSFGKSKARMLAKDRNKTTFKDVAGVEEAIEEVSELVEFLKDPEEIPKARRPHSQGRPDGGCAGHGQDPAGQGHCRRGGRERFSASAVRTSWKCLSASVPAACATCLNRRAKQHAVSDFHRRN